ncbi:ketopantoate reductase family protein [Paraferrimonas sp. SM1919]|uniref:ketopantoate reductase family protein n=1 Tax=Paraferrimonas sp. SM1919 TaxID=2662263 RepID=UPI0013D72132|nr:2-dehydropantoate 2-reductase [Paraferrimonas sp. SM1919]
MDKIAIIGAGAIGRLINHKANPLHLWPFIDLRNKSINISTLHTLDGHTKQQTCIFLADVSKIDLLIVTLKAYQVLPTLLPLLGQLKHDAKILLLHNGMGTHLEIANKLTQQQTLLLGTTNQGAMIVDGDVHHTGVGDTYIGHYCGPQVPTHYKHSLCQQLDANWTENIQQNLWNKLAINCCINPLTAIFNLNNGQLSAPQFYEQIEHICYEVCQVAQREGIKLTTNELVTRVQKVIELTASNSSSMRQDILLGRPTEIDYINQYICACAAKHGIIAPINQALVTKIKSLHI